MIEILIRLFVNSILGLMLIGVGWFVWKFPNMIAGINTMSEEKKKNVDIEGLSKALRNGMTIIGLIVIMIYPSLCLLKFEQYTESLNFAIIIIGIVILVMRVQKYDLNRKNNINS